MAVDKKEENAPQDKFNLVYIIFGWLGVGTLLPWNFFITVNDYWKDKFDHNEEVQNDWGPNMSMASMIPNVTFLLLNAVFGHRLKTTPRLLISLIFVIVLFAFTCAMAKIDTDEWQDAFWSVTIASIVLININAAIFQGGLLGVAGKFPPKYIGFVFSGQAIGGIFASVTNVVVMLLGASQVNAAFYCFLIAVIFLAFSLAFFVILSRTEFFKYYLDEEETEMSDLTKATDEDTKEKFLDSENAIKIKDVKINPLRILGQISLYGASVYLIFAVTLACFPPLTASVSSNSNDFWELNNGNYFIPVCCFVFFNLGDYIGRFVAEYIQWPKPGKVGMIIVFVLSIVRVAFIPLFLNCNIAREPESDPTGTFNSDWFYIIFVILFSLTNGYLSNICMMSAPQIVQDNEKGTASSLMVALLGLGLGSGALLSYPVKMLI